VFLLFGEIYWTWAQDLRHFDNAISIIWRRKKDGIAINLCSLKLLRSTIIKSQSIDAWIVCRFDLVDLVTSPAHIWPTNCPISFELDCLFWIVHQPTTTPPVTMRLLFCGPKCSICCTLLSIWGIIMLPILGGLLTVKSVAFKEDFHVGPSEYLGLDPNETNHDEMAYINKLVEEVHKKYDDGAFNCYVATAIYGASFLISLHQWYLNHRAGKI